MEIVVGTSNRPGHEPRPSPEANLRRAKWYVIKVDTAAPGCGEVKRRCAR